MSDRPTSDPAPDPSTPPAPSVEPAVAPASPRDDAARFRTTLLRVMLVQLVTLVLLWLVQRRYTI